MELEALEVISRASKTLRSGLLQTGGLRMGLIQLWRLYGHLYQN